MQHSSLSTSLHSGLVRHSLSYRVSIWVLGFLKECNKNQHVLLLLVSSCSVFSATGYLSIREIIVLGNLSAGKWSSKWLLFPECLGRGYKASGLNLVPIPMLFISVPIMLHQELMKGPLSVFSITEPWLPVLLKWWLHKSQQLQAGPHHQPHLLPVSFRFSSLYSFPSFLFLSKPHSSHHTPSHHLSETVKPRAYVCVVRLICW